MLAYFFCSSVSLVVLALLALLALPASLRALALCPTWCDFCITFGVVLEAMWINFLSNISLCSLTLSVALNLSRLSERAKRASEANRCSKTRCHRDIRDSLGAVPREASREPPIREILGATQSKSDKGSLRLRDNLSALAS